mmetsp:Transcript_3982/g.12559  ORF Transcript_3982/g.12559 Transcript_3982/m.12559 type:complete len:254 (-) Transcript_3982:906-1667(-)
MPTTTQVRSKRFSRRGASRSSPRRPSSRPLSASTRSSAASLSRSSCDSSSTGSSKLASTCTGAGARSVSSTPYTRYPALVSKPPWPARLLHILLTRFMSRKGCGVCAIVGTCRQNGATPSLAFRGTTTWCCMRQEFLQYTRQSQRFRHFPNRFVRTFTSSTSPRPKLKNRACAWHARASRTRSLSTPLSMSTQRLLRFCRCYVAPIFFDTSRSHRPAISSSFASTARTSQANSFAAQGRWARISSSFSRAFAP